jgi:protein PhnA
MSENLPACPLCSSIYTYEMGSLLVCPECAHEWAAEPAVDQSERAEVVIKDSSGNVLQDGDSVTIIKDIKVKGSSTSVKVGTKVKNIRLISPVDGHDIDAKVDGFGSMYLKSSIVKKVL